MKYRTEQLFILLFAVAFLLAGVSTAFADALANPPDNTDENELLDPVPDDVNWSSNVSEMGGPQYRKIALNGRPLSDTKPQNSEETDVEKEETYIDALNLNLRHQVTDVHVPLVGGELNLSVRRNIQSEIWNNRGGLRPNEKPENVFGACWSSSLAPYALLEVHWAFIPDEDPFDLIDDEDSDGLPDVDEFEEDEPITGTYEIDRVTLTAIDESGTSHRYTSSWQEISENKFGLVFIPLPSGTSEQDTFLAAVSEANYNGGLVQPTLSMSRKFGMNIQYQLTDLQGSYVDDRVQEKEDEEEENPKPQGFTEYFYYRASEITDRYGKSKLSFAYPNNKTILPELIRAALSMSAQDQTIRITRETRGAIDLVKSITDPRGHVWNYSYGNVSMGGSTIPVLNSVTGPSVSGGRPVTRYAYGTIREKDLRPVPPKFDEFGNPTGLKHKDTPHFHVDVRSITDPKGNTYSFTYAFDHSKLNFDTILYGWYTANGNPRSVTRVTLPADSNGAVPVATFENRSLVAAAGNKNGEGFYGYRSAFVVDAVGNSRFYHFLGNDTKVMESQGNPMHTNWLIYFGVMKIHHFRGKNVTFSETNEAIQPFYDEGDLVGIEEYTFDTTANMALKSTRDFYGNTTQFLHEDPITYPPEKLKLIGEYANVIAHHTEPTQQIDAFGKVKTFKYTTPPGKTFRIMSEVVDEEGRKTVTQVDDLGRRINERIFSTASSIDPVQETVFEYGDTRFPAFMTRKTVRLLESTLSWAKPLVTEYIADEHGRLESEIVDRGQLSLVTRHTYDLNNNRLSTTNPRGFTTRFAYDNLNRLTQVSHPPISGVTHTTRMTYDLRGNKTLELDENGNATLFIHDKLNRVIQQVRDMNMNQTVDAGDLVTRFAYNRVNSRVNTTDPNGNTSRMEYDAVQRLVKLIAPSPLNFETRYAYGENSGATVFDATSFKPTQTIDPRGFRTTVFYDKLYRPVTNLTEYAKSPLLVSTNITQYDNVGNVRSQTDPVGNTTETIYDALNRPVQRITADGKSSRTLYSSTGLAFREIDELGRTIDRRFDGAGRAILERMPTVDDGSGSNPVRPTTRMAYDPAGNLITNINPRGFSWVYTYDSRNRKTQEKAPLVFDVDSSSNRRPISKWSYDPVGNTTGMTDPRGFTTTTIYDAANRPTEVHQPSPDGTTPGPIIKTVYDLNGNITRTIDPNQKITQNSYDALNRLAETIDAQNIRVRFEYDAVGNRTALIDGRGLRTAFTYDGLNRLLTTTDPQGRTETLEYDGLNKRKRTDSKGRSTEYSYDVRNRLQSTVYPGRAIDNREYTYDDVDNLLSVEEPGKNGKADVVYIYDNLDRVLQETSAGVTQTYRYDVAGNRILHSNPHLTIGSTYDPLNRLVSMIEGSRESIYRYDLTGNIRLKEYRGDAGTVISRTHQTFDRLNRLTLCEERKGSGSLITRFANAYDQAGNIKEIRETYSQNLQSRRVVMEYDNIYRLTAETVILGGTTSVTGYTYDRSHNRTSKTSNGITTTYRYNSLNQLTSFTEGARTVTFAYDRNGNRTARTEAGATDAYSYDDENRLIKLVKAGKTYSYTYDYRTRRIERVEGSLRTKVAFSGGTSIQEFNQGASSPAVQYIRGSDYGGGIGGILYSIRSGSPSFNYYNRRGDVVTKLNGTGNVTWQASYEAFGSRTQEFGSNPDRQRANTKEEDPTGLLNEGFRYRDLETGAFITRDPAGFIDGPNLYAYVKQNPWTYWDPEGLFIGFIVDAVVAVSDTYQYATGGISGAEYSGRMALTAASVVANAASGGTAGLAVRGASLAARATSATIKVAKTVDKGQNAVETAKTALETGKALKEGDISTAAQGAIDLALNTNKGNKTKNNTPGQKSASKGSEEKKTYERPSGYRKGVQDKVWENAKEPSTGQVRDPGTGRFMSKDKPWDMGHKPGHEFRKHQQSARERGLNRKEFLDEHNDPSKYRPETPESNRSHKGEDMSDEYLGDAN
jgi:RHS repeat-associated protein